MSNITVQDNFLPIDFFRNLQSKLVSTDFPWYLSGTVRDDDTEHSPLWYNDTNTFGENNYQLVHVAYHSYGFSSDLLSDEVTVLAEKINAAAFLKIKCNLVQRRSDIERRNSRDKGRPDIDLSPLRKGCVVSNGMGGCDIGISRQRNRKPKASFDFNINFGK